MLDEVFVVKNRSSVAAKGAAGRSSVWGGHGPVLSVRAAQVVRGGVGVRARRAGIPGSGGGGKAAAPPEAVRLASGVLVAAVRCGRLEVVDDELLGPGDGGLALMGCPGAAAAGRPSPAISIPSAMLRGTLGNQALLKRGTHCRRSATSRRQPSSFAVLRNWVFCTPALVSWPAEQAGAPAKWAAQGGGNVPP